MEERRSLFIRACFFFVFVTTFLMIPVSFRHLTRGFKIAKMQIDYPFDSRFELGQEISSEILSILNQTFYYLGKGSQSFVFSSEDGRYVIKLFRYHHKSNERRSKVYPLLEATRIACQFAKEETGVIYAHLNLTEKQLPTIKIKDPIYRSFKIPLDEYRFVLQKKCTSFEQGMKGSSAESCIDAFITLVRGRIAKGIRDADSKIYRNFGFLDGKGVEFDFGNYEISRDLLQPENQRKEMLVYINRLRHWLENHAPDAVVYLDKRQEQMDLFK